MAFKSSNSNVLVTAENVQRVSNVVAGNIPVFDSNMKIVDSGIPATGGGGVIYTRYQCSFTGLINNTSQGLYRSSINDTGSGNNPTTSVGNAGFGNGGVDPLLIPVSTKLIGISLKFAQAAVGVSTVGTTPTVRLALYSVGGATRTLLAYVDVVISPTGVQSSNNLSVTAVQGIASALLALNIPASTLLGIEFVNQPSSANGINAVGRLFVVLTFNDL